MSTASSSFVITVTRRFGAPAERVFDAFFDPAKARRFLFATNTGEMVRAEIDPRVGGAFAFVDRRGGQDVAHTGTYLEIDRPHRLVFLFSVEGSQESRVAIDISLLGAGCELTLTHEMDRKWAEHAERTTQGWTMILEGLARAVGEGV